MPAHGMLHFVFIDESQPFEGHEAMLIPLPLAAGAQLIFVADKPPPRTYRQS